MPIKGRYLVVKNKGEDEITYYDINPSSTLDVYPKKNVKIKDGVKIDRMIVINPSLVDKLIDKKINKRFELIINSLMNLYDSDDGDSAEGLNHILNELNKLKSEYRNKYRALMDKEKQQIFEHKVAILEHELKERIEALILSQYESQMSNQNENEENFGRGSR